MTLNRWEERLEEHFEGLHKTCGKEDDRDSRPISTPNWSSLRSRLDAREKRNQQRCLVCPVCQHTHITPVTRSGH